MGAIFLGATGGSGRGGKDVIGFNGFLTLKCSKNTAFSLQTYDGICVNTAFCMARTVPAVVFTYIHIALQLMQRRESQSDRPSLIS